MREAIKKEIFQKQKKKQNTKKRKGEREIQKQFNRLVRCASQHAKEKKILNR